MLKGIIAGDYKKPGWNEYIPADNLPIDGIFIRNKQDHPRLLSLSQIQKAKTRKNIYPYNLWYQKLKRTAQLYDVNNEPELPLRRANNLKILAFMYWLDGESRYLRKIERSLEKFPDPPKSFAKAVPGRGWGDNLEAAQTLNTLNVALDLVYYEIRPDLREATLKKIGIAIQSLHDIIATSPSNNHMVVISISFMQTAMLMDNTQKYMPFNRVQLWNSGLQNLGRALGLVAPDGGYAEGTYYAGFILSYLSPFIVHFDNMTFVNLLNSPVLERLILWYMANDKGSDSYTLFDDGFAVPYFILPVLSSYSGNRQTIDLFWRSQPPYERTHHNMVEAMCVFKNSSYNAKHMPDAIQFYPDMGQAIFKDNWLKPEIFGSFLGENERWFADKHEDIDPLSVEISAFGEDFIVDAGYGQSTTDFYRHLWYKSPYAHNGILVDGMGTYRNPIWGDPLGSTFSHAFQTENNAAVTLSTKIQDVEINRKVYFLDKSFFLILDDLKTHRKHAVSANFNYSGQYQRINSNTLRINKNDAVLDFLHLSSARSPLIIKKNLGLRTLSSTSQKTASFQLEHSIDQPELSATVIYPSQSGTSPFFLRGTPVIGNGILYQIFPAGKGNGTIELAVNKGLKLATAKWQSDARFLYYKENGNNQTESVMLENFSYFKSDQLEIYSSKPVTLFLEKKAGQWTGYVESSNSKEDYTLSFRHMAVLPVRFNRIPLRSYINNPQENFIEVTCQGSGILEMGSGPAMVKIPYQYHSHEHFLVWLAARYKEGQNYQSWSDYDKQIMENQIMGQVIRGAEQGASFWSSQIFGEEKTITHALNSLGIQQETTADKTYRSFDIAHRYQLSGDVAGNRWQMIEDGAFTEEGILIRNLRFQTHQASGAGLEYQLNHFYKGHQAHSLKLQKNDTNFLHYQTALDAERNRQQAEIYLSNPQYYLHPGYAWSNNSATNQQFINAGMNHMTMSLWRSENTTGQQYYQSFSGYGQNWSVNLEGAQDSDDRQLYKQAMFLRFPGHFNIAQQLNLKKSDIWQISRFFSQLYWQASKTQFSSFVNYYDQQWFQGISANSNTHSGYLSSYIDLHNLSFGKNNEARISYFKQLKNGLAITSHALYSYREIENRFSTTYQQNLYIPLSYRISIQPMIQFSYPSDEPLDWIGSGFGYSSENNFYGQVLTRTNNNSSRLLDYQLAYQTPSLLAELPLDAWLHMQQSADQIQWIEMRLLSGSREMQPGIYYSYDRYSGMRWEGYLQWRW